MDRFIVFHELPVENIIEDLKSNMDRFIALPQSQQAEPLQDLKSNMDRFIVFGGCNMLTGFALFKIQYG